MPQSKFTYNFLELLRRAGLQEVRINEIALGQALHGSKLLADERLYLHNELDARGLLEKRA